LAGLTQGLQSIWWTAVKTSPAWFPQLTSELGTAREVVSRQLKVFEKQEWIAVHRGSVEVLQPRALSSVWQDAEQ